MRLARISQVTLTAALLIGAVGGGRLIAQNSASDADREKKRG